MHTHIAIQVNQSNFAPIQKNCLHYKGQCTNTATNYSLFCSWHVKYLKTKIRANQVILSAFFNSQSFNWNTPYNATSRQFTSWCHLQQTDNILSVQLQLHTYASHPKWNSVPDSITDSWKCVDLE